MPEKKDYYEVLGLTKGASVDEIKAAYKRLAKEFHPDVSKAPDAEAKFKEVQEAYGVLSNEQKKAQYDQFGHAGTQGFSGYRGYGGGGFSSMGPDVDFSEIFSQFGFSGSGMEDLFGDAFARSGGGRRRERRGEHIRAELDLKFNEAIRGAQKDIHVERLEPCATCKGSGAADGASKISCTTCKGSGVLRQSQRTPFGMFTSQSPCPTCGGEGRIVEKPCADCKGHGIARVRRTIKVSVPAGIDNGQHLRLVGQGHASTTGGPAGDLFVVAFVEPHDVFKRDGSDVYCEVPVSFAEASLGASVDVPTIDGEVKLHVPAGSASGTVFRLKGKGVADPNTKRRGDEFVKIKIEVPKKLSKRQKDLLNEFAEEEELGKKRKGFFDRVVEKFK